MFCKVKYYYHITAKSDNKVLGEISIDRYGKVYSSGIFEYDLHERLLEEKQDICKQECEEIAESRYNYCVNSCRSDCKQYCDDKCYEQCCCHNEDGYEDDYDSCYEDEECYDCEDMCFGSCHANCTDECVKSDCKKKEMFKKCMDGCMENDKKLEWTDIYRHALDIVKQYSKEKKRCIEVKAKFEVDLCCCRPQNEDEDDEPPYTEAEKLLREEKVCP